MLTDEELAAIETRHRERKEFHDHVPSGPYFYDSLGYIHNELALRPPDQPKSKLKRVGVLVRSRDWFRRVNMDAHLTREDREIGSDLGQYLAMVCDQGVEKDVAALLAEVRRLGSATRR